jgi:hypothetical protein
MRDAGCAPGQQPLIYIIENAGYDGAVNATFRALIGLHLQCP